MDWQETVALTIVAVTVVAFAWSKLRRRKAALPCDAGCGCSSQKAPKETMVFKARRGERPRVVVKSSELAVAHSENLK